MPVLATYFTVRRGRDPFFKFYMKTLFPRQVREYGEKYGIKFHFIDLSEAKNAIPYFNAKTKLVWMETPSNPLIKDTDVAFVAALAKSAGAKS